MCFAYIGRSEIWKIMPLKKILEDLCEIKSQICDYEFVVVTDDDENFKAILGNELIESMAIRFLFNLKSSELSTFLSQNVDLLFAMGTSILEGSSLGIPSVLVDASFSELRSHYKYRWLYESSEYVLGKLSLTENDIIIGHSMKEIVVNITNENIKKEVAQKCFDYTRENHSLENVAQKFVKYAKNTTLKKNDLSFVEKYFKIKNFFRRILK